MNEPLDRRGFLTRLGFSVPAVALMPEPWTLREAPGPQVFTVIVHCPHGPITIAVELLDGPDIGATPIGGQSKGWREKHGHVLRLHWRDGDHFREGHQRLLAGESFFPKDFPWV